MLTSSNETGRISEGTTLPPIAETSPRSSGKSRSRRTASSSANSTSPALKMASNSSSAASNVEVKHPSENPFRKAIRRPSVSSPRASPTRRLSKASVEDLPDVASPSGKTPVVRRDSNAFNVLKFARKPSFGSIGLGMTNLLRARNAFANLKNRRKSRDARDGEDVEFNQKSFEIKELPKEPRFASTLSAEAQYAMMKGYEDVVYNNMCSTFPEAKGRLRRNKTPHEPITLKMDGSDESDGDRLAKTPKLSVNSEAPSENTLLINSVQAVNEPPKSPTPTKENDVISTQVFSVTQLSTSDGGYKITLQENGQDKTDSEQQNRNLALPKLPTMDKQKLVMTYRYQSAMDILDTLRQKQGLHRLTPRDIATLQTEPVSEYNRWSYVWSHEFELQNKHNGNRTARTIRNR